MFHVEFSCGKMEFVCVVVLLEKQSWEVMVQPVPPATAVQNNDDVRTSEYAIQKNSVNTHRCVII